MAEPAVVNASPLIFLSLAGLIDLLQIISPEVIVPEAVAAGPLTFVHAYELMVPSVSVPVPFIVTELVGRVSVRSGPALATGTSLVLTTVTVTLSCDISPLLALTINL